MDLCLSLFSCFFICFVILIMFRCFAYLRSYVFLYFVFRHFVIPVFLSSVIYFVSSLCHYCLLYLFMVYVLYVSVFIYVVIYILMYVYILFMFALCFLYFCISFFRSLFLSV